MNFTEALKLMKEGKKVRISFWNKDYYIHLDNYIITQEGKPFECMYLTWFESNEWEVYEEPETLSDKILVEKIYINSHKQCLYFDDVKEAVQELYNLSMQIVTEEDRDRLFNRVIGEELLK